MDGSHPDVAVPQPSASSMVILACCVLLYIPFYADKRRRTPDANLVPLTGTQRLNALNKLSQRVRNQVNRWAKRLDVVAAVDHDETSFRLAFSDNINKVGSIFMLIRFITSL